MIIGKTAYEVAKQALKATKPSADNVPAYTEFGLLPTDFGSPGCRSWDAWLRIYGGPEHTGVTLTKEDVQHLRKAISYIIEYAEDRADALTPTSKAVLKKVGLQPADLELSGTWD